MAEIATFPGFDMSKTTPVPDGLIDELLTELNGSELKVLLYIIRRTKGFNKDSDTISFSQFTDGITTKDGKVLDRGCGVKNRTVLSTALGNLESKGYITSVKRLDPQGDKAITAYSLKVKASKGGTVFVPPVVSKPYHGSTENVPRVVRKTYLQERDLQETDLQNTGQQEDSTPPVVSPPSPSLPSALIPLENLSDLERAFWDLWCSRSFNKIAPKLNQTAYKHIQALAPHVKTEEQINSLIDYSRQKLKSRGKPEIVYLGNLDNDVNDWLQTPASTPKPPEEDKPIDFYAMTKEERIAFILASPYNLPPKDPKRDNLQRCMAYLNDDEKTEIVKRRSEQCPPELADVMVFWTRQPDHKGDPVSNYKLYEDIPLKEAIAYFYEGWDYLLPYQIREIKLKQKLAQKVTA